MSRRAARRRRRRRRAAARIITLTMCRLLWSLHSCILTYLLTILPFVFVTTTRNVEYMFLENNSRYLPTYELSTTLTKVSIRNAATRIWQWKTNAGPQIVKQYLIALYPMY